MFIQGTPTLSRKATLSLICEVAAKPVLREKAKTLLGPVFLKVEAGLLRFVGC